MPNDASKPHLAKQRDDRCRQRYVQTLWRACCDGRYSTCGSCDLHELDWSNWWEDDGYIHVRAHRWGGGETWHCVRPKPVKNRRQTRLAVRDGRPFWIFDGTDQ